MSYSDQEIESFLTFAERLSQAAREETLMRFRKGGAVENKAGASFDPVTDADRQAEAAIRALITETYPEHGVIGEEFGIGGGEAPWRWVLDPVDGTRAFVCGVPTWTTLIALEYETRPVLGVIDQPHSDDCWIAGKGETRLRRNGVFSPCRASSVTTLSEARLSTTDPRSGAYFNDSEAAAFARIADAAQVCRFSLDAYGYGLLASGELDLIIETGLKHHDYAALAPVIEGAGGVITNWRGEVVGSDERGEVIAAATPELHEAALGLLSKK